jgi:hypothetical protein
MGSRGRTSKPKKPNVEQAACPTCGPIGDGAWRIWKDSDPEWVGTRSNVPDSASRLVVVSGDEEARGGRGRALKRCPDCGAWFEWVRSYEFLANGSEDEETLTRIDAAAAAAWIARDEATKERIAREAEASADDGSRHLGTDALGYFYDEEEEP